MKILYDHQIFSIQKYGGISKYFVELMKSFPPVHQYKLALILSDNQYLKENNKLLKKINVPWPDKKFKGKGFIKKKIYELNQTASQREISAGTYDLLHPTYYDPYFLDKAKKPFIITVHDLTEFKFKEQFKDFSLISQMKIITEKANHIISISENTKKDLIDIFNIHPDKIDVIYHGFSKYVSPGDVNPFGPYVLFVGKRNGYKNFSNFVKAMQRIMEKDRDLKLICVGQPFTGNEKEEIKTSGIDERTKVLGVDENRLSALYRHALAFVFPSLYEGFGMPILEAFANNCPVCLSNASSFPEIAGNAGVYFEPTDPESIEDAITRVIYDTDLSDRLTEAGRKRLENFSWEKCAIQTTAMYERTILNSKN